MSIAESPDKSQDHVLAERHRDALEVDSGISPAVIAERGYRTSTGYSELKSLGIAVSTSVDAQGLLLPLHTVDGKPGQHFLLKEDRMVPLTIYRPDTLSVTREGEARKYLNPLDSI